MAASPEKTAAADKSDHLENESIDSDNPEVDLEKGDVSDVDMKDVSEAEEDKNEEETNESQSNLEAESIYDQTLLKPLFEQREKSLKELLNAMDEFSPIIPDAVTDHYLAKAGFKTTDHRIKRLLALATQKFIGDIASDAYQFSRIRAQHSSTSGTVGRGRPGPGSGRVVLTMDSLSGVLGDYGVNTERPDFYR